MTPNPLIDITNAGEIAIKILLPVVAFGGFDTINFLVTISLVRLVP